MWKISLMPECKVINPQSIFGPSILTGAHSLKHQIHLNRLAIRRLAVGLLELIMSPKSAPPGLFGTKLMDNGISFVDWHKLFLKNCGVLCAPVTACQSLENMLNPQPPTGDHPGSQKANPMSRDQSESQSSFSSERGRGGHRDQRRSSENIQLIQEGETFVKGEAGRGSRQGSSWSWS